MLAPSVSYKIINIEYIRKQALASLLSYTS